MKTITNMSARADPKALRIGYFGKNPKFDVSETSKLYGLHHSLAYISRELKSISIDDKKEFVNSYPEVSAQVFRRFNDFQLGQLIVDRYLTDRDGKTRQIAFCVKDLLQARRAEDKLERLLGMISVPLTQEHYNQIDEDAEERIYL